jgi:ubiquinol-cytochrome c reductase cytochrome c subunit
MARRSTAAAMASLVVACASAPALERSIECPAPGPRTPQASADPALGDAQRGAELFASECAGCHASAAERRAADAPRNAPRLDCTDWLATASDAYLYDAIDRGPGAWGHGTLPPLGERLAPGEIADLVAYLRSQR